MTAMPFIAGQFVEYFGVNYLILKVNHETKEVLIGVPAENNQVHYSFWVPIIEVNI